MAPSLGCKSAGTIAALHPSAIVIRGRTRLFTKVKASLNPHTSPNGQHRNVSRRATASLDSTLSTFDSMSLSSEDAERLNKLYRASFGVLDDLDHEEETALAVVEEDLEVTREDDDDEVPASQSKVVLELVPSTKKLKKTRRKRSKTPSRPPSSSAVRVQRRLLGRKSSTVNDKTVSTSTSLVDDDGSIEFIQKLSARVVPSREPSVNSTIISQFLAGTPKALLTMEQEVRLGNIMQRAEKAEKCISALEQSLGRKPTLDESALAAGADNVKTLNSWLCTGNQAKALLYDYNVRLVLRIAHKYARLSKASLTDLFAEGLIGLEKAVSRFEPDRGFRFTTYAYWWILRSVSRSATEQSRVVRLPYNVVELHTKIGRARQELMRTRDDGSAEPTPQELAKYLDVPVNRILAALHFGRDPVRMAQSDQTREYVRTAGAGGLGDGTRCTNSGAGGMIDPDEISFKDPLEDFDATMTVKTVMDVILATLPDRERNILRLRYGLNTTETGETSEAMHLDKMSKLYELSKERIRQIELQALKMLKSAPRREWMEALMWKPPSDWPEDLHLFIKNRFETQ